MELDKELKQSMIESTRRYLEEKSIPYRFIKIRNGVPVVIVDIETFYSIIDRNLENDGIYGRYLAQGSNGWSAYMRTQSQTRYQMHENLTEYQASCIITETDFGRKPKLTRYAMGVL